MVKYFCDKCEKEVEDSSNLVTVKLSVGAASFSSVSLGLCPTCNKKLGLKNFVEKHRYSMGDGEDKTKNAEVLYSIVQSIVSECLNKGKSPSEE